MAGIDGKVIAITGASSGIGRAAALLLAGRGATVVLGARRIDELEAVVRDIESAGGIASHRRTDVAKREDVAALTALASNRHGKLDVLINNAGIGPISKLDELRVEDWEAMVDITSRVCCTASRPRCPFFVGKVLATSSTRSRPPASRYTRRWRSMPPPRMPCAP